MKTGFFSIAALSLVQLAVSQPHRQQQHKHGRRDDVIVTDVVTDVSYTNMDIEEVVVYVDQDSKPVSTSTKYVNHAPSTVPYSSPTIVPVSTAVPVQSPVSKVAENYQPPGPPPYSAPAPPPSSKAAPPPAPTYSASPPSPNPPPPAHPEPPKPAPSSTSSTAPVQSSSPPSGPSGGGPGFSSGVSYSPYNADQTCKSTSQVATDLQGVSGYQVIRLYGTDCNQVANVIAAIKGKNVKLFLGIFHLDQIADECKTIASAVNGDWSIVNTVSVGNELVDNGGKQPGEVIAAIGQTKSALKAAGYNGPVVTVDTMNAMAAHPELCQASDFCAINCHAFFDGNVLPENAGDFVLSRVKEVSKAAGGKSVVVTETGWPTQGGTNNKAVPSKENQQKALASIKSSFSNNVILYNMFNDLWKTDNAHTFGAEKFWGIMGDAPA